MENKKMKVAELFAGVGGFRLGLEKSNYEIVWSNQWEPSTKIQHASKFKRFRRFPIESGFPHSFFCSFRPKKSSNNCFNP